jgi:hypothetical protein
MKHLLSTIIGLFILTGFCKAQDSLHTVTPKSSLDKSKFSVPENNSKEYFESKRNRLNTTAWVFLGTGVVLGVVGIITYDNANHGNNWGETGSLFSGIGLMVTGGALTVASVPIFIRAGYYKSKAMSMSANLKFEPYQSGVAVKQYPAIGLRISL